MKCDTQVILRVIFSHIAAIFCECFRIICRSKTILSYALVNKMPQILHFAVYEYMSCSI